MTKRQWGMLTLALTMMILFCGCSFLSGDQAIKKTVDGFLSAVRTDDTAKAKEQLVSPDDYVSLLTMGRNTGLNEDELKTMKDSFSNMTYTLGDVTVAEDQKTAVVVVTMTAPDYSDSFKQALEKSAAETDNGAALSKVMKSMAEANPKTVQKAATCTLVQDGEKWLIDLSDQNLELQNAISGNLLNALQANLKM